MPDEKVLQVAILIWGCAFCAIAALCIFLSSNYFEGLIFHLYASVVYQFGNNQGFQILFFQYFF